MAHRPRRAELAQDHEPWSSLADLAHERLRSQIVTLRLRPGSMLTERDIVEAAGLGRTPVRDALRRLAAENLVEVFPRRGVLVTPVDIRDLGCVSEVRFELEGLAARLAAERATGDEKTMAEDLAAELHRAESAGQEQLIDLDRRLHRFVHRCSHNRFLDETLDRYLALSLRMWHLVLDRVARLDGAVQEHEDILRFIARGDGDRAERTARAHVRSFERAIREVL